LDTHLVEADYAPVVAEGAPASVYMRLTDVAVLPGYSPKFSRAYARWVEEAQRHRRRHHFLHVATGRAAERDVGRPVGCLASPFEE
jgi:hypothetical protein